LVVNLFAFSSYPRSSAFICGSHLLPFLPLVPWCLGGKPLRFFFVSAFISGNLSDVVPTSRAESDLRFPSLRRFFPWCLGLPAVGPAKAGVFVVNLFASSYLRSSTAICGPISRFFSCLPDPSADFLLCALCVLCGENFSSSPPPEIARNFTDDHRR